MDMQKLNRVGAQAGQAAGVPNRPQTMPPLERVIERQCMYAERMLSLAHELNNTANTLFGNDMEPADEVCETSPIPPGRVGAMFHAVSTVGDALDQLERAASRFQGLT